MRHFLCHDHEEDFITPIMKVAVEGTVIRLAGRRYLFVEQSHPLIIENFHNRT